MRHLNPTTRVSVSTDVGGRIMIVEKPGLRATTFRGDGRAAHIEHTRTDGTRLVVERSRSNIRYVEAIRPGGVRIVTIGSRGFVERPYGRGLVARTYVVGGRSEVRVYRMSMYRNVQYTHYVPRVVYAPAFYGWAVRPWREPVRYAWAPVPVAYVGYYAPEPRYSSASLWLTDFMMAENLRMAYESGRAAGEQENYQDMAPSNAPMTREVKSMVADQVAQQIEVEQLAAVTPAGQTRADEGLPAALDPKNHVFVVSSNLDVTSRRDGAECTLSAGDVIERRSDTASADGKVDVAILSAKDANCSTSFETAIDVAALQDMHNQFREQIAAGLRKLADNSGAEGLPVSPQANAKVVAEGQAPPDEQAGALLTAQFTQADQSEEEVRLASDSAI
ncbi:MAG: hypothetical protein V4508_24880 [Pseudomonadota bacterium]